MLQLYNSKGVLILDTNLQTSTLFSPENNTIELPLFKHNSSDYTPLSGFWGFSQDNFNAYSFSTNSSLVPSGLSSSVNCFSYITSMFSSGGVTFTERISANISNSICYFSFGICDYNYWYQSISENGKTAYTHRLYLTYHRY